MNTRHADVLDSREQICADNTPVDRIEIGQVATRRPIRGLPHYTVSASGIPRKWDRLLNIYDGPGGLPVIYVSGFQLFLDEVVAHAFLGAPDEHRALIIVHFDGNPFNCQVDNLSWHIDAEWEASETQREMESHMRPANRKQPKQRVVFFK